MAAPGGPTNFFDLSKDSQEYILRLLRSIQHQWGIIHVIEVFPPDMVPHPDPKHWGLDLLEGIDRLARYTQNHPDAGVRSIRKVIEDKLRPLHVMDMGDLRRALAEFEQRPWAGTGMSVGERRGYGGLMQNPDRFYNPVRLTRLHSAPLHPYSGQGQELEDTMIPDCHSLSPSQTVLTFPAAPALPHSPTGLTPPRERHLSEAYARGGYLDLGPDAGLLDYGAEIGEAGEDGFVDQPLPNWDEAPSSTVVDDDMHPGERYSPRHAELYDNDVGLPHFPHFPDQPINNNNDNDNNIEQEEGEEEEGEGKSISRTRPNPRRIINFRPAVGSQSQPLNHLLHLNILLARPRNAGLVKVHQALRPRNEILRRISGTATMVMAMMRDVR
ncbi:hypothetical protein BCR34DRAFT_39656 [Clohesyomyces aquaticus]|uniref:Uncharacterized protein n=1 Tax=Clohesyomyces aquaticus TaxID=1231657 RepID=A0A1Y2A4N5_9PLEO|nr:hypothetical protein BCR34DRAFT_39656 [Clohesyomyces aquaticus]